MKFTKIRRLNINFSNYRDFEHSKFEPAWKNLRQVCDSALTEIKKLNLSDGCSEYAKNL